MTSMIVKIPGFLILIAIIAIIPLNLSAQTGGTRTEFNNNSADLTKRSSIEVDPTTNALNISIPLQEYPGRGGSFPVKLNYNSKVWRTSPAGCWTPPSYPDVPRSRMNAPSYAEHSSSGWTSSLAVPYIENAGGSFTVWIDDNNVIQRNENTGMPSDCGDQQTDNGCYENDPDCISTPVTYTTSRLLVHMPGGSTHELRQNDTAYITGFPNTPYYAVDGSRLKYDQTSHTLWMPDGSRYLMNSSTETQHIDRNGNKMTYNHTSKQWTDTVGRVLPKFDYNSEYLNLPKVGGTAQYQLHWESLSDSLTNPNEPLAYAGSNYYNGAVMSNLDPFLFGGDSPMVSAPVLFDPLVLAQIDLPNGQSYKFSYNKYGEIDKVTLPTGGYKRYRYAIVPTPQFGGLGNSFEVTNRGVVEMWESPNGNPSEESSHHWTFESTDASYFYTTKTIAADGTYTIRKVHSWDSHSVPESPHWGFNDILDGRTLEESFYNSAGALRSRTLNTWTNDGPVYDPAGNCVYCYPPNPINAGGNGPPPARNARLASKIEIIVDTGGALAKTTTYEYDSDLNITAINEHDFVPITVAVAQAASPTISQGGLLRRQETTYFVNDPNLSQSTRDAYRARNLAGLPTSTRVRDGNLNIVAQSAIKYDETLPASCPNIINWTDPGAGVPRGNPTTVRQWLDTTNSWIETHTAYDQAGNVVSTSDALGNVTTFTYMDSFSDSVSRNTYAFPTQATTAVPDPSGAQGSSVGLTASATYDFNTGLTITSTDPNGQTTTVEYNDPLGRIRKITEPNGRQTIIDYGAGTSALTRWVKVRSQIDETKWKEGLTWYDGAGKTVKSQSVDTAGDVFADAEYDNMGRAKKFTNPYRAGETVYWTETFYDNLGRPSKVKTPDNAEAETFYSLATTGSQIGVVITVEDQANKSRRSIINALGRLTRVDEPNNAGQLGAIDAPNQPTVYSYNVLSNLTQIQQIGDNSEECGGASNCTQTRTFVYDSLSRLKSASHPENGLTQFSYDNNGNLITRTDARGIITTYAYDALNRVKTRTYTNEPAGSETPDATYYYDNLTNAKGTPIKVSSTVSTTEHTAFDVMGRVTRSKQTTDGVVYGDDTNPMTYTYNLAGALIEQKYPSGRVVKNVLDNDGDIEIVQSKKTSNSGFWNYAQNFSYTAAGAVSSMQLGNFKWESTQFNSRLQPIQIGLGTTQNATDLLELDYEYGTLNPGTGQTIAGTNNGNIAKQTITVQNTPTANGFTATQYYAYDSLNRIYSATENFNPNGNGDGDIFRNWRQTFKYDRLGNRTFDEGLNEYNEFLTTTLPRNCNNNTTVCAADRKVLNPSISPNNNRINLDQDNDSQNDYNFDSSGNTTKDAQNRTFTYDADNKQTEVRDSSNQIIGQYFYDGDGKRVKKYVPSTGETTVFVYDATGRPVAEYSTVLSQTPQVSYLTNDHLGSPRVNTDQKGMVTARHDYQPFGKEIQRISYGSDSVRKKFTGYEFDNETLLNFAQARYQNDSLGRFTSPDGLSGTISDPQTLNKYSYVVNNPLNLIDPSGFCGKTPGSTDGTPCIWIYHAEKGYMSVSEKEYGDGSNYSGYTRVENPDSVRLDNPVFTGDYADVPQYQEYQTNKISVQLGSDGMFYGVGTEVNIQEGGNPIIDWLTKPIKDGEGAAGEQMINQDYLPDSAELAFGFLGLVVDNKLTRDGVLMSGGGGDYVGSVANPKTVNDLARGKRIVPSVSLMFNKTLRLGRMTPNERTNIESGTAVGIGGGSIIGGQINYIPSTGDVSVGVGLTTPGVWVTGTHLVTWGTIPFTW